MTVSRLLESKIHLHECMEKMDFHYVLDLELSLGYWDFNPFQAQRPIFYMLNDGNYPDLT